MKKAQQKINLSQSEIEALSQRLQDKSLCDKDYAILIGMLGILVTLNDVIREKNTSIKRLLKRIFGIKTEKRKKLFNDEGKPEDQLPATTDDNNDDSGEENQKPDAPPPDESPASPETKDCDDLGNNEENATDKIQIL